MTTTSGQIRIEMRDWATVSLDDLASVYNAQVAAHVPHCYPLSPEEFGIGRDQVIGDDLTVSLHSERVIVGMQGNDVLGFAHVRVGDIERSHRKRKLSGGFIHFLTYAAGHRAVGQGILEACETHFADAGASIIYAFDGHFYRFHHLGFPLVSDRMGQVYGLFGLNGYRLAGTGEVYMESLDYAVAEPVLPEPGVEIQVLVQEGRGNLPNVTVRAMREGKQTGTCIALACGDFCRAPEAQDRIFVKWLGVEEEEQGRGWGRYLLTRTLWEARRLGYRHTVISTNKQNYRAQLFYTNYGYTVTDTIYGFVKENA